MLNSQSYRFILFILFTLLSACTASPITAESQPRAIEGVLDLRDWDFETQGLVKLNGEWEFYWEHLLTASALSNASTVKNGFIDNPGPWNGYLVDGQPLSGDGYATYRLTILLDETLDLTAQPFFAVKTPLPITTAHNFYIDNTLIGSAGKVGATVDTMVPQFRPYVATFTPQSHQLEVIAQVSNFHDYTGGIIQPIYFGPQPQLHQFHQQQAGIEFFLMGCILIMGLYHVGLFSLRRQERSPLYFGVFCLVTAARMLSMIQPELFSAMISDSWSIFTQFLLFFFYSSVVALLLFARSLFPAEFSNRVLWLFLGLTGLFIVMTLFASSKVYTFLIPFTIFGALNIFYVLYVIIFATRKKRDGAAIFLVGYLVFVAASLNDALVINGFIETGFLIPGGIFALISSQAYLLSRRSANTLFQTETLSTELQHNNESLKQTQEELRRSEEKYRTIFEDSKDVIFVTTAEGKIEAINPVCFDLFGYQRDEILNQNALVLFANFDDGQRFQEAISRNGVVQDFELKIRRRNGEHIDCQLTATLRYSESGEVTGYQGILRDMTAFKQAEAERRHALALQRDKEAADAANQAKSAFLANMSHELRTPLNAILGFGQLLTRGPNLTKGQQENLHTITTSGEHLLTLINQVLDLSKIEAGRMMVNKRDFDLDQMLTELEAMFRLRAERKGLHLIIEKAEDVPRFIYADEIKLRQILINLLSNALKFTDEGQVVCHVSIAAASTPTDQPSDTIWLYFAVSDTGPGIAPDEMSQLFEAFGQTETGQHSHDGTGLGLPISLKLARLLGGNIRPESPARLVQSQVDQPGTTFHLEVPVLVSAPEAVGSDLGENGGISEIKQRVISLRPDQPRYRILIVDDHDENRRLLRELLAEVSTPTAGFEVREAENGQEALRLWETFDPHLIWLDMRMPVLDGYEVTKQIKATVKGKDTAILALTASAFEEEKNVVMAAGCNDFLRKPFLERDIFRLMNKHLGVQYIYEDHLHPDVNNQTEAGPLSADTLRLLPLDLRKRLAEALDVGDIQEIGAIALEIETEYAQVASALQPALSQFEYDRILMLLDEV